jgi:ribose transport system permease protein
MSSAPDAASPGRLRSPKLSLRQLKLQEYALVGVILLLIVAGAILESDSFLSSDNLLNVLRQGSIVGVLAMGMTFVIATAGIDLSVGSMLAAAAIVGAQLVDSGSAAFILGCLAMGIALGAVNGAAIAYGKVVAFIATLAMLTIARGLALLISDKTPVSVVSLEGLRWFGNGEVIGIPSAVLVFVAVTAFGWVLLNRTAYGRYVVAVGGNTEAARIAGVKVQRIIFSVYVLSGICAAIAAVLLTGRLASASPVAGGLLELQAIAAVVIGGTSLAGGKGSIVGTIIGALIISVLNNGLQIMSIPQEWQNVILGIVILVAVYADMARKRAVV